MSKICTDLKQSRKLIELGLDPETSDAHWWLNGNGFQLIPIPFKNDGSVPECVAKEVIPAWSLTALLDLMPIITKRLSHPPSLTKSIDGSGYFIEYPCYPNLPVYVNKNPVAVVYKAMVWLLENGYIKPIK